MVSKCRFSKAKPLSVIDLSFFLLSPPTAALSVPVALCSVQGDLVDSVEEVRFAGPVWFTAFV